jgi:hypothetical protein
METEIEFELKKQQIQKDFEYKLLAIQQEFNHQRKMLLEQIAMERMMQSEPTSTLKIHRNVARHRRKPRKLLGLSDTDISSDLDILRSVESRSFSVSDASTASQSSSSDMMDVLLSAQHSIAMSESPGASSIDISSDCSAE